MGCGSSREAAGEALVAPLSYEQSKLAGGVRNKATALSNALIVTVCSNIRPNLSCSHRSPCASDIISPGAGGTRESGILFI